MQRITIDDVAKAAGVSRQTVSRAINGKQDISQKTKTHILDIIKTLGYRPNRLAQAMNTQRTYMVGLVVPDITNPFFPELARGVQDAAVAHNYNVPICNTDDDPDELKRILESLVDQGVDGIISFVHRGAIEVWTQFAETFQPVVLINHFVEHPAINLLLVDNMKGAQQTVEHLISQGHTKIGMIANQDYLLNTVRRVQGYKQALEKHNIAVEEKWIVTNQPTLTGGYEATKSLLAAYPETTAIFAYNDLMGMGAIRACLDLNRAVPQDVSIIGFDDIQLAEMYSPSLSSVRVDKYEMGQLAFKRILDCLEAPNTAFPIIEMGTELVIRESSMAI